MSKQLLKYFNDEINDKFQKMNHERFGGALVELKMPKERVLGRDEELHALSILMNRPSTPVAILLADAGVGKTSLVQTWIRERQENDEHYYLFEVEMGSLSTDESGSGDSSAVFRQRLERLIPDVLEFEHYLQTVGGQPDAKIVLFIDEAHNIISSSGEGSKAGGDMLKRSLAGGDLRVILATTNYEYETYFSADEAFERRLSQLRLDELDAETTQQVLKNWLLENAGEEFVEDTHEDTYRYITQMSSLYREHLSEPAKSIDVIETMVSYAKTDGDKMDNHLVDRVFVQQYLIDLDFRHNIEKVMSNLKERVYGQPLMLFTMDKMLKRMALRLEPSSRPLATMMMIGTTGVGKTETAKALTEGLFNDENLMITFNMSDYTNPLSEQRFRNQLGTAVQQNPTSVILLDEVEKANENVMLTLLPILDEGRVTYQQEGIDGQEISKTVSLRNSIVIATTNAGANTISQLNMYARETTTTDKSLADFNEVTDNDKNEWEQQSSTVQDALESAGIRPELIGRFQDIVPFGTLATPVKLAIVDNIIQKNVELMMKYHDIEIVVPKKMYGDTGYENYFGTPVAMFVVFETGGGDDAHSGGARKLQRDIENQVMTPIRDAVFMHPTVKKFGINTNGKTRFESKSSYGEGKLVVKPIGYKSDNSLNKRRKNDKLGSGNNRRGAIKL